MTIKLNNYDNLAILNKIFNNKNMKQEFEIINYNKVKHIRIFIDEIKNRTGHIHSDYEVCFILQGTGCFKCLNNNFNFKQNDIIFIDSNEAHSISGDFIGLFFQISNSFLISYLPELHSKKYANIMLSSLIENSNQLHFEAINVALNYFKESCNYRIETINFALKLLYFISNCAPSSLLKDKDIDTRKKNYERIQRILNFIDNNYMNIIKLEEIATLENITTTHLSHLFKKSLGVTIQEYINNKRLENAIILMKNSSKGIVDISYDVGFSDPKYLTKMFKNKYGCTAKQFRKNNALLELNATSRHGTMFEKIYDNIESINYLISLKNVFKKDQTVL